MNMKMSDTAFEINRACPSTKASGTQGMRVFVLNTCHRSPPFPSHQSRSLQSSCRAHHLSAGRQVLARSPSDMMLGCNHYLPYHKVGMLPEVLSPWLLHPLQ
ncbi:hypothetical protein L798_00255 [Zootermopsis nevadensis]|uniref:Uncharacterized protein n=1 Tax=Zootermopsis nevadensis TaxID=136037 RepID=A0A067QV97_ZOONE|nr:hypothetical protein L798_00255 [Zootermopsis nevadensis]